jgi:hypothetical protein
LHLTPYTSRKLEVLDYLESLFLKILLRFLIRELLMPAPGLCQMDNLQDHHHT